MPAEDQARGQCDDRYRDIVALAGVIRSAIKDDRYCEDEEAYA
jgi:hypothetical protein